MRLKTYSVPHVEFDNLIETCKINGEDNKRFRGEENTNNDI